MAAAREGWRRTLAASGPQHAGTIAYFGLLSMLPLTLVFATLIAQLATRVGPSASDRPVIDQILEPLSAALPFLPSQIKDALHALAETHNPMGFLTYAMVLFGATAVFDAAETGVNAALGTQRKRHFLLTKVLLASGVVGAGATIFLWQLVKSLVATWFERAGLGLPGWLLDTALVRLAVEAAVLAAGFFVIVKFLSRDPFHRRDRWTAALVFAVVLEVTHYALALYLEHVAGYEKVYGAAGAIFGLLLWLYLAAFGLLYACGVTAALAAQRVAKTENA